MNKPDKQGQCRSCYGLEWDAAKGVQDEKMTDEKRYTAEDVKFHKVTNEQMDTGEGGKCDRWC